VGGGQEGLEGHKGALEVPLVEVWVQEVEGGIANAELMPITFLILKNLSHASFVEPSTKLVQACLTITTTPTRKNLPLTSKGRGEPPWITGEPKGNLAPGPVLWVGLPHLLPVKMLVAALGAVLIWLLRWLQQVHQAGGILIKNHRVRIRGMRPQGPNRGQAEVRMVKSNHRPTAISVLGIQV